MSCQKKTIQLACGVREMVIRRNGKSVAVDHIRRTANIVTVLTSRFVVLNGGRPA